MTRIHAEATFHRAPTLPNLQAHADHLSATSSRQPLHHHLPHLRLLLKGLAPKSLPTLCRLRQAPFIITSIRCSNSNSNKTCIVTSSNSPFMLPLNNTMLRVLMPHMPRHSLLQPLLPWHTATRIPIPAQRIQVMQGSEETALPPSLTRRRTQHNPLSIHPSLRRQTAFCLCIRQFMPRAWPRHQSPCLPTLQPNRP